MSELSEARLIADKATGVGGSEIAHVMSEAPYGCQRRLAYEKLGVLRDYDDPPRSKRFMARGMRLEAIVAEQYQAETRRVTRRTQVRRMAEAPHRLVHVDRLLVNVADPPREHPLQRTAPLECKVPGEVAFKKIVTEGLPAAYILQIQWAMLVTSYPWAAFGILWADGWESLGFDVTANPELAKLLADAVDRFWAFVEGARAAMAKGATVTELPFPERLAAGDPRCARCLWRRTCWGDRLVEILKLPKDDAGLGLETAPELTEPLEDFLEAKRLLAEHEELVATIGAALREQIGERQSLEVNGHRVYFRMPKPSVGLDMDALRAGLSPEALEWLFKTYGKAKKQTRSLRIY